MSLDALAAFAAKNNNAARTTATPLDALSIEDARGKVQIKDGNKQTREDGQQALKLVVGRYTLSLDIISKGATRINAPADKVEEFTELLQGAIDAGQFDDEIVKAQAAYKEARENPKPKAAATATAGESVFNDEVGDEEDAEEAATAEAEEAGVDLSELD